MNREDDVTTEAMIERAKASHRSGRLDEAADHCASVLGIDPDHADALHILALVRMQQGRPDDALSHVRRALRADPENAAFLNSLGLIHRSAGSLAEAETAFRAAVSRAPNYIHAKVNLGSLLCRQGRFDDARSAIAAAIELDAKHAPAYFAMAELSRARGENDRATLWSAAGWFARRRYEKAHDAYRAVVEKRPRDRTALVGLGQTLTKLNRANDAIGYLHQARAVSPDDSQVLHHLAAAYTAANRDDDAMACYDRIIAVGDDEVKTHILRAHAILRLGRFSEGWAAFELRLRDPAISQESVRPPFERPAWDGRALDGERLFVHTEQGKGDIIQFVRYLPLVRQRGGHVIFECETELLGLMASAEGYDELIPKSFSTADPYVEHDLHVSLMSLPHIYTTMEATIPASIPYLGADPVRIERWRSRMAVGGFRVGLCWAGNPLHANDANRSIELSRFAPIAAIPRTVFYGLQVGAGAAQAVPEGLNLISLGDDLANFADTAAVMASLDLVISVDTATAHLAGALGRPVWTLLPYSPDWRWMLDRTDTPWYPTMRLYRQPAAGDWETVFRRVSAELKALAGGD